MSDSKSPADVVAALERRDDLTVSSPIAASLGGYSGLQVGPSNRMRIWVLDVGGRPVVFLVQSFAATPAADMAAAQRIVDSIVIKP